MRRSYIVGIDEVGRGPLAGPLVVGAVLMPVGLKLEHNGLRDSKKLTATAREEWAGYIKAHPRLSYSLASVSPGTIDKMNVSRAANLAALRAFSRLAARHGLTPKNCSVYLDGGLYLGNARARLPGRTVIKGDEKIAAIALASILAKVHRDGVMARNAKKFPDYGFEAHKGYGTKTHRAALRQFGLTALHRLSFNREVAFISKKG